MYNFLLVFVPESGDADSIRALITLLILSFLASILGVLIDLARGKSLREILGLGLVTMYTYMSLLIFYIVSATCIILFLGSFIYNLLP
jgi:hypothetical protein